MNEDESVCFSYSPLLASTMTPFIEKKKSYNGNKGILVQHGYTLNNLT